MHYRHYKGGIYELVCEAVLEADHTPVMVYRGRDGAGLGPERPAGRFRPEGL